MSEDHYMSEERGQEPAPTEVMDSEVFTEEMTSVEKMIPLEDSPAIVHEEKLQEQNREIEQTHEESSFRKKKQRRRTTTFLSQILKQTEKNGGEINKIRTSIESLQKQQRLAAVGQSQSIKQIQSRFSQLQKQVTRIQKDIQRARTVPAAKTRIRKLATSKPKSKKSKSVTSTKVRRRTKKK
jgi:DNA repair exonuclease SbcCD ATPase subunit